MRDNLDPHDLCFDFVLLDHYELHERHDDALERVDRIDQRVGGDGYLNMIRSRILAALGDTDLADEKAKFAMQQAPEVAECVWRVAGQSLKLRQYTDTLHCLQVLEEQFDVEFDELEEHSQYDAFLASPKGQHWLRDYPTN